MKIWTKIPIEKLQEIGDQEVQPNIKSGIQYGDKIEILHSRFGFEYLETVITQRCSQASNQASSHQNNKIAKPT